MERSHYLIESWQFLAGTQRVGSPSACKLPAAQQLAAKAQKVVVSTSESIKRQRRIGPPFSNRIKRQYKNPPPESGWRFLLGLSLGFKPPRHSPFFGHDSPPRPEILSPQVHSISAGSVDTEPPRPALYGRVWNSGQSGKRPSNRSAVSADSLFHDKGRT
jgi:hypothetical protein